MTAALSGGADGFEPLDVEQAITDWRDRLAADPNQSTDARVQRRVAELLEGVA